jgi:hypothetical protein
MSPTVKTPAAVGRIAEALAKAGEPFSFRPPLELSTYVGPNGETSPAGLKLAEAIAAEAERALSLTLELWIDPSPTSPADADGVWMLYSLHRDHAGSTGSRHYSPGKRRFKVRAEEPSDFLTEGFKPLGWLMAKLRVGLAWPLRRTYDAWAIADGAEDAEGFLVWEEPSENIGARTVAARRADAETFLGLWNAWDHGEVYGFTLRDGNGEDVGDGPCGGFIIADGDDTEYLACEIHAAMPEGSRVVAIKGDAAGMAGTLGFRGGAADV